MQRYFSNSKETGKLFLINDDIYHITRVMRMKDNDKIEVIYNNDLYICNVIINELPWVDIISKEEGKIEGKEIILAIPLLKEQKMDFVLQKATELGVTKIIPVTMERSIVKLDEIRFAKKLVRWQMICKEASEQSFRNVIPNITNVMTIDDLKNIDIDTKLVCSTKEKDNIINKYVDNLRKDDNIIFVIGPEGGLSANEEDKLNSYGYKSISLGNRILRVETATFFVASIINYINME